MNQRALKNTKTNTKTKRTKKKVDSEKISTDVSLSVLTFAFFLIDLMSSTSNQLKTSIFQRNEKNETLLVADILLDQNGVLEQTILYENDKKIVVTSAQTVEKLKKVEEKKRGIEFYLDSQNLANELKFDFENLKKAYNKPFQNSFERASEVLYWIMFLEPYLKLETAQDTINFCYTLVRSLENIPSMKLLRRDFAKQVGIGWEWELTWALARQDEKVKRFLDTKKADGEILLNEWKKYCEKLANNNWTKRKRHIQSVKKHSRRLRKNLKNKFNLL